MITVSDSPNKAKDQQREELERHIAEFQAKGGKVQQINPGNGPNFAEYYVKSANAPRKRRGEFIIRSHP